MNATECIQVVAYIAARCPAMRLEDATAASWFEDLQRFTLEDCHEAARAVSARQAFVSLHELIAEATVLERRRLGRLKIAENQARDEQETRALTAVAEPVDREALKRRLQAGAIKGGKSVPKVDRRADSTKAAEARAELERLRTERQGDAS